MLIVSTPNNFRVKIHSFLEYFIKAISLFLILIGIFRWVFPAESNALLHQFSQYTSKEILHALRLVQSYFRNALFCNIVLLRTTNISVWTSSETTFFVLFPALETVRYPSVMELFTIILLEACFSCCR